MEMTTQLECELKQKMKTNVLVEREGNNIHSQKIKDELTNCIHCLLVDVPCTVYTTSWTVILH